jgi:hypothetical protein
MTRLLLPLAVLVLFALPLHGDIIYVDPDGGGDYTTIPVGVANATVDDTVLVAAGTYTASGSGWPIVLHSASPTIMSEDGAAATTLSGGTPFQTMPNDYECRVRIIGFSITDTPTPIARGETDAAWFHFTDNVVEGNGSGLNAMNGAGLIARNLVSDNGERGIYTYHFWGTIEDNEVCGHERGIAGACCENPTVRRNHVHHNTVVGSIPGMYAVQIDNLIEYNGFGVFVGPGGEVQHNVIRYNETGVRFSGYETIPFHGNDLYGNTLYNFEIWNCLEGPVDATMNWWGTTDPDEIAAGIWDAEDDPGLGCHVVFEPFCLAPGCATPVESMSWGAIKAMYR